MTRREMLLGSAAFALEQGGLPEAIRLIGRETSSGRVAAATLYVRNGATVTEKAFGKASSADAVFLLASITKPMTVSAVMLLSDRRQLSLAGPVQRFLPEFRGNGRERVLVRHLLTHTSGLPDMLPENIELRKRHAPLADFVAGACRTPLLFAPGAEVRYQSMGILLAAEIVSRITKTPFPALLEAGVFRPLGMRSASLGLGGRAIAETMQSQVDERSSWDWNSAYWRNLGAPWGGAHANARDVARFLGYFANPQAGFLKKETISAMITKQTPGTKPQYGFGWRLNDTAYGKNSSAATFGHGGSTGTLCWHDPKKDRTFVLLTTLPAAHSNKTLLHPASDMVAASA
jgi:CubicO group peptidase (beta-lactamase class C family)